MKRGLISLFVFVCGFSTGLAEVDNKHVAVSQVRLAEGYEQLKSGKTSEALKTFGKILEQDADNLDAHFGQAFAVCGLCITHTDRKVSTDA